MSPTPRRLSAAVTLAVIAVASCASPTSAPVTGAPVASTTVVPETAATTTTVIPATTTIPATTSTTAAAPTTTATTVAEATTTTSEAPVHMPSVVCMNLQGAQDLIQVAGVFFSTSFDASGAGRMQIVDSNWIVVSQTPPPGEIITEGSPRLGAVKTSEPNDC